MNRSGRVNLIGLFCLVAVLLLVWIVFAGRESLTSIGGRFMDALAHGDVNTLTKMSYLGTESEEQIRKQWEFATNVSGKYYNFVYRVTSAGQADDKSASVRLGVTRNVDAGTAYEENFQLPMVKVGDEWKVDVAGISREMYPGLPR